MGECTRMCHVIEGSANVVMKCRANFTLQNVT